jgi:hypothetical protein
MLLMFTRFGKQDIIIERCESGKEKVRRFRWVISQKIAGENVEFNCLLSVPPKLLLQMVDHVDDTISSADELALDASKEFVNIANGNACAKLRNTVLDDAASGIYETTKHPTIRQGCCRIITSPVASCRPSFAQRRGFENIQSIGCW